MKRSLAVVVYCLFSVGFAQERCTATDAGALVINEFMALNGRTLADGPGEYDDWIELFNPGDQAIDLEGYFVSDDPADLDRRPV